MLDITSASAISHRRYAVICSQLSLPLFILSIIVSFLLSLQITHIVSIAFGTVCKCSLFTLHWFSSFQPFRTFAAIAGLPKAAFMEPKPQSHRNVIADLRCLQVKEPPSELKALLRQAMAKAATTKQDGAARSAAIQTLKTDPRSTVGTWDFSGGSAKKGTISRGPSEPWSFTEPLEARSSSSGHAGTIRGHHISISDVPSQVRSFLLCSSLVGNVKKSSSNGVDAAIVILCVS
jgi:hypothetical protein